MTTTINAACACKTFHLEVSFANSSLPIDRALCLCTTCRQISGSCGNTYIQLPPSVPPIYPTAYALTSYDTSDQLTRYFCSTCGSHIFVHRIANKTWHLATGLWDRTEGLINWTGCKWVGDTRDGGVSIWFKEIDDGNGNGTKRTLERWMLRDGDGETVPEGTLESLPPHRQTPEQTQSQTQTSEADSSRERLNAQCHCGGVKYYITRPNAASRKAYSPFPDVLIPYNSGTSAANPSCEPWFLRGADNSSTSNKYLAGTCACPSCRVSLGFEIQTWAFVPKCNIFLLEESDKGAGQQEAHNEGHGAGEEGSREAERLTGHTASPRSSHQEAHPLVLHPTAPLPLRRHNSSPGVYRDFCPTCGATVFWHCDERPELIDVSVGLLDPAEGARVERWLDWAERVSFKELAVSSSLVGSLQDGLVGWCKRRM